MGIPFCYFTITDVLMMVIPVKILFSDGALCGVSVDYAELAKETGMSAISVLLGIKADNIAVKYLPTTQVYLNKKTAQALNFTFSTDLLNKASYIVE